MIGTAINVATVVAGAVAGKLIGSRLPVRVRETLMQVIALVTLVIGADMALKSRQPLILLGSLVFGAITGELVRVEDGIHRLGEWSEARLSRSGEPGDFTRGFVATSILFCVGPLTLLGCLEDGLRGEYRLLLTKAVLDGVGALAFSSVLGWGVLLSAVTVLVVQGSLTLGAHALAPVLENELVRAELFAVGGVMLLGVGLRLLELKPIRVGNLLPALLYAPALTYLALRLHWLH